jgi:hypothetical protein
MHTLQANSNGSTSVRSSWNNRAAGVTSLLARACDVLAAQLFRDDLASNDRPAQPNLVSD